MARRLLASSLVLLAGACERSPRAGGPRAAPPDAGTLVTVYLPAELADRLMNRLTAAATRNHWALSVRTDSAAQGEADLVIVDSAGTLVGRPRPGAPAAAQARRLAEAVLR